MTLPKDIEPDDLVAAGTITVNGRPMTVYLPPDLQLDEVVGFPAPESPAAPSAIPVPASEPEQDPA